MLPNLGSSNSITNCRLLQTTVQNFLRQSKGLKPLLNTMTPRKLFFSTVTAKL
ncbi:hypothetical protein JCM15457_1051 [Liquorilactobacillus sucicola DSM 21376 = JCM 15457]|nr:hypothetical protein JCM15457_1051 [Liquorilactobacillus sucicola DSM 21376 = JCM 15457]